MEAKSWGSFQPEWTAWDQTVKYCAFAYQQYIAISSFLTSVCDPPRHGAVWHRRQLFVATPTTIEWMRKPIDVINKMEKKKR
ncbi:hypothetical protein L6452_32192 [Arctium lappa]|uniref:Uncharacterized protein n=1 Tax=Arctium lappa TaxID=4217 RepID=A0ACB8Z498_ARCLA|nr:hypothetical protein L6452_32192 [Arctium lappa]